MSGCQSWGIDPEALGPMGIDYNYLYYCSPTSVNFLMIIIMLIWVIFLINLLAQSASNYFSPTLSKICEKLHLALDIAGVTFLAFGNGAPDFFSLIASFSGGADVLVGVGALLGGSMFVCTVVVGSIAILCPCDVSSRLFLRDISFHIISVCIVAVVASFKTVTLATAFSLIAMYFLYVATVLFPALIKNPDPSTLNENSDIELNLFDHSSIQTAFWHSDTKTKNPLLSGKKNDEGYSFLILKDETNAPKGFEDDHEYEHTINLTGGSELCFEDIIQEDYYNTPELEEPFQSKIEISSEDQNRDLEIEYLASSHHLESKIANRFKNRHLKQYENMITTIYWQQWALRRQFRNTTNDWNSSGLLYKSYFIFEYPFNLARDLTIPILDDDRWNKLFAILHPLSCPLLIVYIVGHSRDYVGKMPLVLLVFLISLFPSLVIYLVCQNSKPPRSLLFSLIWILAAFSMCIFWIYMLAGELITCLSTLGAILNIPVAFLGLTILAWGNSIGDFFTNTAVAKQGLGAMALAGCYAGPVFNILIGFGSALVYASSSSYPEPFPVIFDTSSIVSIVFLIFSLSSTVIIVSLRNFKLDQPFGIYLITLYIIYSFFQAGVVLFQL